MKVIYNNYFKVIFLFVLMLFVKSVEQARILCFFPIAYKSHQTVLRSVTERLADIGHELFVITPLPHDPPYENITDFDISEVAVAWQQRHEDLMMKTFFAGKHFGGIYKEISPIMSEYTGSIFQKVTAFFEHNDDYFDLIIVESLLSATIGWKAKFNAPVISLSTYSVSDQFLNYIGSSTHLFLYHDWLEAKIINFTLFEKIYHIFEKLSIYNTCAAAEALDTSLIREYFGENSGSVDELQRKMDLLIINSNPLWDSQRPKAPLQIYAPAFNLKPPTFALPQELQKYLNSSSNGVVYMSFGSEMEASLLPADTIATFMEVFGSMQYDVIMKWNGELPPNPPKNILFQKWLPQRDLLYHPNVKVFITHCGLHSIDEAIEAEVPLVGIPLNGDQVFNSLKIEQFGLGVALKVTNLNYDELRDAIVQVADANSIYRKKIHEYSSWVKDFQRGSLDVVIHWVDYVLKYGTKHMKTPYVDIFDYLMLDLLAIALMILIFAIVISVLLFKTLLRVIVMARSFKKKIHLL